MTVLAPRERPRPRSRRSGAFCVASAACPLLLALLALVAGPVPAEAQEPRPEPEPADTATVAPPTIPVDPRLRTTGDTVPGDTIPTDTLGPPPPTLPALDPPGPASPARGVWEWDRAALRRLPDLSVLQLLQRLPGVVPVRADMVNQSESAAIFGATAGAIRYIVDGFELDALQGATFDPSRFPLVALERVRVERRVTGATVHLRTLSPEDPRPYTLIEAGTGDYDVQLFRGVFLAPGVLGGPLAAGFERLAADGTIGGRSSHSNAWLKWSWVRDPAGIQIEYRQSDVDRTGIGDGLSGLRRDWVMRARAARGPVTGEVYAGASRLEDERGDVVIREGTPHGGLRLGAALDALVPVEATMALRFRDHARLPFGQLDLTLRALPLPLVAVEAEVNHGWWREGPGTERWTARAQAGPLAGVSVFSEVSGGVPLLEGGPTLRVPSPAGDPLEVRREGVRLGAEARRWGGSLLVAGLRSRTSEVTGFDLPFEAWFPRVPGGEATGLEVIASLPTGWDPVSLDGWYVAMDAPADWLYLPAHHARGALSYHHLPLPSGNLEIFGRLEHSYRSAMSVPGVAEDESGATAFTIVEAPAYRSTNLEVAIRVLSVQAFIHWENILHRPGQHDIPGFNRPGQHILYGVKWEFVN